MLCKVASVDHIERRATIGETSQCLRPQLQGLQRILLEHDRRRRRARLALAVAALFRGSGASRPTRRRRHYERVAEVERFSCVDDEAQARRRRRGGFQERAAHLGQFFQRSAEPGGLHPQLRSGAGDGTLLTAEDVKVRVFGNRGCEFAVLVLETVLA